MSLKTDRARMEFILEMVGDIELIISRHHGIMESLEDKEGFHAIMMCFLQIGEALGKLESEAIKQDLPIYKVHYIIFLSPDFLLGSTDLFNMFSHHNSVFSTSSNILPPAFTCGSDFFFTNS